MCRLLSSIALGCLLLLGCQGGGKSATTPLLPEAAASGPSEVPASAIPQLQDADTGMTEGVLGVYTLSQDGETTVLDPVRIASAQGDEYALSVRPFMSGPHLKLTGTTAIDADTNEYQLRFTHPFALPADLIRPATAQKRLDLFLFDTQLVYLTEGTDTFFDGDVITNLAFIENPSGFRPIAPLIDLDLFPLATANVFPYSLLRPEEGASPAGNYDAVDGWIGEEFLNATGFDVIPQGGSADVAVRGPKVLTAPLSLVVVARYMDPRGGATPDEQRANRLPDPADDTALRYYLPEACGDVQDITITVEGSLVDDRSTDTIQVTAEVLDWDNGATIAGSFPDAANPSHIARLSGPTGRAIDIPELRADLTFPMIEDQPASGAIGQYRRMVFDIWNADQQLDIPQGESRIVQGLFRTRDQQDAGGVHYLVLNESLEPQPAPAALLPSTRYQRVSVEVESGKSAPVITGVSPLIGNPGGIGNFAATTTGQTPNGWSWNFGGGATPNTSAQATPQVLFGSVGLYNGTVIAKSIYGDSVPFPFQYTVAEIPIITGVLPTGTVGFSGASVGFTAQVGGGAATSWSWNFGGGASPNTPTNPSPNVTLGAAGSYSGYVTASNQFGTSPQFGFDFEVLPAAAPQLSNVQPTETVGIVGAPVNFTVDATNLPTTWNWNFGGGASPNTSNGESPTVNLAAVGTFNGNVQVGNQFGSNSLPFSFTVIPAPTAPVVQLVSPIGALGPEGTIVMFEAVATGAPTSWSWQFDGGANPNTSTDAEPTVALAAPGTYSGVVQATNAIGTSAPFPFEFIVSPPDVPTVESVSPTGTLGLAGIPIEFSATATNSPTAWSWNFGGGATPNTSSNATPTVTLGSAGLYQGTVTAFNGGGASAPFPFTYRVRAINAPGKVWRWDGTTTNSAIYPNWSVEDSLGNSYLTGTLDGTFDLDPGPGSDVVTVEARTLYLIKLDAQGDYVWGKAWEITEAVFDNFNPQGLVLDAGGNPILCGVLKGTIDLDPGTGVTVVSASVSTAFALSLSPTGNFRWGGTWDASWAGDIELLPSGNLLFGGEFTGSRDFNFDAGVDIKVSNGDVDLFMMELTSAGAYVGTQTIGGTLGERFNTLAHDGTGARLMSGNFIDTVDFDPGVGVAQLNAGPVADGFILKLAPTGEYIWAKKLATTDWAIYPKLANCTSTDAITTYGYFKGKVDFDPGPGTNERTETVNTGYMLQLTPDGIFSWLNTGGNVYPLITLDDDSFMGVTLFTTPITIPGYPTLQLENGSAALIPVSATGAFGTPLQFGGTTNQLECLPQGAYLRSDGYLYINGSFHGLVDLDPSPVEEALFLPLGAPDRWAGFQLRLSTSGAYD